MKPSLNPSLKVGDTVVCYHMEGETSVLPGTKGVVTGVTRDPFEDEEEFIYGVNWGNGSTLSLVSSTDTWKKIKE
jgi:hypothetical protein